MSTALAASLATVQEASALPAPYGGRWAVYVHFPFCLHRCNYCDFATVADRDPPRERALRATLRELELRTAEVAPAPIASVFFGGGTPSLWGPAAIGSILRWLDGWAGLARGCEVTLEANPGAAEEGDLRGYVAAGVNRVSLGVQALDDERLRRLDRVHDAAAARAALRTLATLRAEGGLRGASADLLYGVPGQREDELAADVRALLDGGLSHLSAYALTVEAGTPLQRLVARGAAARPDEAAQVAMLAALPALVGAYGLQRYEVSNFALPGHECRHNLAYWRGDHYLAVGVGAHGFLPTALPQALGLRTANARGVAAWFAAIEAGGLAEAPREVVTAASHRDELLLTGLRLREGLSLARVEARLGGEVAAAMTAAAARPGAALVLRGGALCVEEDALYRLDDVIAATAVAVDAALRRAARGISRGGAR